MAIMSRLEDAITRILILNVLLFNAVMSQGCGELWTEYGGSCYRESSSDTLVDYQTAKNACISLRAHLATITSEEETAFIINQLVTCTGRSDCDSPYSESREYWIGLEQNPALPSEGTTLEQRRRGWTWVDGSEKSWTNWFNKVDNTAGDEPSGDSGRTRITHKGEWSDKEPEWELRYICEYEKVRPTTTTTTTTRRPTTTSTSSQDSTRDVKSSTVTVDKGGTEEPIVASAAGLETSTIIGIAFGGVGFIILVIIIVMAVVIYRRKKAGKARQENVYYNDVTENSVPQKEDLYHEVGDPGYAQPGAVLGSRQSPGTGPHPGATPHVVAPGGVEYATVDRTKKNSKRKKSAEDEDTTVVDNRLYAPSLDLLR